MMTPSHRKGYQFEHDLVVWFKDHGFRFAERRIAGAAVDRGDIAGLGIPVVIEAKNAQRIEFSQWLDEAEKEAKNDGADLGILVVKRRGRGTSQGYAVLTVEKMTWLLRKAYDLKEEK